MSEPSPQQRLVYFMRMKVASFPAHINESFDYFSKEDERAIFGWTDAEAQFVLIRLVNWLQKPECLTSYSCPFCLLHYPQCSKCEYRKTHGDCSDPMGDFQQLESHLQVYYDTCLWEIVNCNRLEFLAALRPNPDCPTCGASMLRFQWYEIDPRYYYYYCLDCDKAGRFPSLRAMFDGRWM
jgi:hypothetical protein